MIHLPDWLKAAKDTLTATRQWRLLVKEIHVRVAEELSKQNIKFSDLNPGEQQSLVEQMHARLLREAHDSIYNFETAVSSVVDTEVAAEVRRVSAVVDEGEAARGRNKASVERVVSCSGGRYAAVASFQPSFIISPLPPHLGGPWYIRNHNAPKLGSCDIGMLTPLSLSHALRPQPRTRKMEARRRRKKRQIPKAGRTVMKIHRQPGSSRWQRPP